MFDLFLNSGSSKLFKVAVLKTIVSSVYLAKVRILAESGSYQSIPGFFYMGITDGESVSISNPSLVSHIVHDTGEEVGV